MAFTVIETRAGNKHEQNKLQKKFQVEFNQFEAETQNPVNIIGLQ